MSKTFIRLVRDDCESYVDAEKIIAFGTFQREVAHTWVSTGTGSLLTTEESPEEFAHRLSNAVGGIFIYEKKGTAP